MRIGSPPAHLEQRIQKIRAERSAVRDARAVHPELLRIATESREPLPLRLLHKVGFEVAKVRDRHMAAYERSRAAVNEFRKQPRPAPARPRIHPSRPAQGLPHAAAPMGAAGTSVVLQGPAIQVNCPDGYADVGEECNCALATNTMGFFIENAGHGGCCAFAQPQPPGQTADIWFEHTPDADGYFTYYPYVYLNGQVVLQVTSQWYAPDYGILSLDLVTSAHQGDFTASSRTNVVNESGSDVHKAYWLNDDMWLLGPAVLPVQAGVPVLIDITANARAEAYKVGNYALMDLCQLGGIRVAFILAVWSPPVPII